jgi:hypothetical protein
MKEKYTNLELEIIEFETEDIITASDPTTGGNSMEWDTP